MRPCCDPSRRAVVSAALCAAFATPAARSAQATEYRLDWPSGPPDLGLARGSLRSCPALQANTEGCVSSLPSSAPNRFMAPLRYDSDLDIAYKRVRGYLASRATSVDTASPGYISAVLPSSTSAPEEFDLLELHFVDDEPVVTFRILASKPKTIQPFCATRGCINGNQALRRELELIRDDLGWRSDDARYDRVKLDGWVPIFLH